MSIFSMFQKTPTSNLSTFAWGVDQFDETLFLDCIDSPYAGDEVWGVEYRITKDDVECSIVGSSYNRDKYNNNETNNNIIINNTNIFEIVADKSSFLPIYTNANKSLAEVIQDSLIGGEVLLQFIVCERRDDWRDNLISQYEDYLEGNDSPSTSKALRLLQNKLMVAFDKWVHNTGKDSVKEIEDKLTSRKGFRYEIRLAYDEDVDLRSNLSDELSEYDLLNRLVLYKPSNRSSIIDYFNSKSFSGRYPNQIMSVEELSAILIGKGLKKSVVSQSPIETKTHSGSLIDLLPNPIKKDREPDYAIAELLPSALKKAKAIKTNKIDVLDVDMGSTVQRITTSIPNGIVFSDIKNKALDIQSALGIDISVIQGKEPNTITFLIPCEQREVIYLKALLDNQNFIKFSEDNPLPFVIGIDMYNQPVYKCLTQAPHLLVSGATNSGKSVFVNALLITLMLMRSPDELRVFLIDPKKVEFIQYEGFSHVDKIVTDMEDAIRLLDGLIVEMDSRYEKLSKAGVRNILSYNKKKKGKMSYIVCAIDEYNDLKMVYPEVEKRIERLGQKARAAGIHLIVATQRPDKNVMSGVIKTNLPSRISFKLDNSNEYKTVFGTGIPYKNLLGMGDGVVKYVGQYEEFIRFQAPVITLDQDEEDEVFEQIKNAYKDGMVNKIELEDVEEIKEEPVDKLKRIISTTGETRVSQLQKEMGIRINTVQDLMSILVEEGWLIKHKAKNKGYELVAQEEELARWR